MIIQVLRQQLQNQVEELRTNERQQRQEVQQEFLDHKDAAGKERDQQLPSLQEGHEAKLDELAKQEESYRERWSGLREKRIALNEKQFWGEEIRELKDSIGKMQNEAENVTHQISFPAIPKNLTWSGSCNPFPTPTSILVILTWPASPSSKMSTESTFKIK
ncbi:MAG: hypothetical protein WD077_05985 [Bacteroidia bacterium]